MKPLKQYIKEALRIINRANKTSGYNYFPQTKEELKKIIRQRIKDEGNEVDLNDIDVSKIIDMSELFLGSRKFNGDISKWDVSNVINMECMFWGCSSFNQDISGWNVSKVINMKSMFAFCRSFNQGLSDWNVSRVIDMSAMFCDCRSFNQDLSNWDMSNVRCIRFMFDKCPIKDEYKPVMPESYYCEKIYRI